MDQRALPVLGAEAVVSPQRSRGHVGQIQLDAPRAAHGGDVGGAAERPHVREARPPDPGRRPRTSGLNAALPPRRGGG